MPPCATPLRSALIGLLCLFTAIPVAQGQRRQIDEELLSGLIQAKQEEVRARVLRNLVQSTIKSSNVATYNTVNDVLDVLLTEKNKSAMIRDITTIVAEHSVAYAASWAFITKGVCTECFADDKRIGFLSDGIAHMSPWDQLVQEVTSRGHGKDKRNRFEVNSRDTDAYLMELHGFILDTLSFMLREPALANLKPIQWLQEKGLFKNAGQRPWQGRIEERYQALWEKHPGQRTELVKQIRSFVQLLSKGSITLTDLAEAVNLHHVQALNRLNIENLSGIQFIANHEFNANASSNDAMRAVFELFQKSVEIYRKDASENRYIARIADFIDKYVILDPEKLDPNTRFGFSIDVEGIILAMEEFIVNGVATPTRNCLFNVRPYFTIGMNYGVFSNPGLGFTLDESNGITTVAWAGEKIGLKWRIWDWKYTMGQQVGSVFKYHGRMYRRLVRPKEPAVSNLYMNLYASGLIYEIADLRSESVFSSPIAGAGVGLTLFNGLETNLSFAVPVLPDLTSEEYLQAGFFNLGIDIPIFEYIRAARAKRTKE